MIRQHVKHAQYDRKLFAVVSGIFGGVYVASVIEVHRAPNVTVRFICDTAEEAESVRKLLEAEHEEIEAVRRRYELLVDRLVNP